MVELWEYKLESNIKFYVQFTNSERMKKLFNQLVNDSWLDFDAIFMQKFNLFTCDNWGLQWWGNRDMLDMPQYIPIRDMYQNITTNFVHRPVTEDSYWEKYETPANFFRGNWYNNQKIVKYFNDEDYRIILINKFKQTYYACTLGNLYEFLNSFFQRLPDTDIKKNIKFKIKVERRTYNGNPIPSFWRIIYNHDFDNNAEINEMWVELFKKTNSSGNSIIMPIPNDVQWDIEKE